jgi:hypothetical protein
MTEIPNDDQPGDVAGEPAHCHACFRLPRQGQTYCFTTANILGQSSEKGISLSVLSCYNSSVAQDPVTSKHSSQRQDGLVRTVCRSIATHN